MAGMDLSHTLGLGRPQHGVSVEIVRELTTADLVGLAHPRGVATPHVKRLTDMHHYIARLVAQGEAGYAIALATGYSESRISILKADPAFQELVASKREEVEAIRLDVFRQTQAKAAAASMDGLDQMHDRILSGELADRDLAEYTFKLMDRTGHGPQSKTQNTNITLNYAEKLAAGRLRGDALDALVPIARSEKTAASAGQGPKVLEQVDFVRKDADPG
jgi:hypothetical protein